MALLELAAMFLVLGTERTTLFDRIALLLLKHAETRMRNLLIIAAGSTAFLTLLLGDTLAVLLVCSVLSCAVRALQDDVVQGHHQRALFEKATWQLPAFRRRQLEDMLWANKTDVAEIAAPMSIYESPSEYGEAKLAAKNVTLEACSHMQQSGTSIALTWR